MFCVYCGDKFNDNKPLVAHRKICKMNPKSEANVKKEEDTKNKLYIDMQKRVQCYDDIFIEVDKFIAKQGFIIDWEEKPSRFTTNVNKQLYGKKPLIDDENNYCGWIGNFKGTITKIDGFETKKSRCSFWDLNGEMSGIYGMKFLRTSGGSWSSGFSGSGFLLVNDFPKIQQQMLGTMKSDQTTESIQNEVSVIQKELQREENDIVNCDEFVVSAQEALRKIEKFREQISGAKSTRERELRKDFKGTTKITLPKITNPFIDLTSYNRLELEFQDKTVEFSTEKTDTARENIVKAMNTFEEFQSKNAEFFI